MCYCFELQNNKYNNVQNNKYNDVQDKTYTNIYTKLQNIWINGS